MTGNCNGCTLVSEPNDFNWYKMERGTRGKLTVAVDAFIYLLDIVWLDDDALIEPVLTDSASDSVTAAV